MTKHQLIERFKINDYDWIALCNEHCVKQHLIATEDYIKQNEGKRITELENFIEELINDNSMLGSDLYDRGIKLLKNNG